PDLPVVDAVSELVEHRVHPPLVRLDVAQDAYVALAVDVDAERVLALAVARIEVAALEHRLDVEPEAGVGPQGERDEVARREHGVEVDRTTRRRVLEEGLVQMPGPDLVDAAVEAGRQRLVELALPGVEGRERHAVDLVEGGEQ